MQVSFSVNGWPLAVSERRRRRIYNFRQGLACADTWSRRSSCQTSRGTVLVGGFNAGNGGLVVSLHGAISYEACIYVVMRRSCSIQSHHLLRLRQVNRAADRRLLRQRLPARKRRRLGTDFCRSTCGARGLSWMPRRANRSYDSRQGTQTSSHKRDVQLLPGRYCRHPIRGRNRRQGY